MRLHPSLKRATALAAASLLASAGLALASAPTHAAVVPAISIDVDGYGAADGWVGGAPGSFTSVLTATGAGTCTLANGTATIAAFDTGSGNPSTTHTNGAVCHLYDATVDYTLTYTGVIGATQTFYRTCVWVLGSQTCTVRGLKAL